MIVCLAMASSDVVRSMVQTACAYNQIQSSLSQRNDTKLSRLGVLAANDSQRDTHAMCTSQGLKSRAARC